jgi:hypothetical protein
MMELAHGFLLDVQSTAAGFHKLSQKPHDVSADIAACW